MKGLFLNVQKAESSIYESGLMIYNNLKGSSKYTLDYTEHTKPNLYINEYDFYIFNYHFRDMGWLDTKKLKEFSGLKFAVILEMLPDDPFVMTPKDFDDYIILDPTIGFPRALDTYEVPEHINKVIPWIGTFGFLTRGKCYDKVVEAVSKEFKYALVRINIPKGKVEANWKRAIKMWWLKRKIEKVRGNIKVQITEDYLSKWDLIKWCSENTLNVFLYDRDLPGLAATTDQCIISERPLAVSNNTTFRHILQYLKPYPDISLVDSINFSIPQVKHMKEVWSKEWFRTKFENMLYLNGLTDVDSDKVIYYMRPLPELPKIVYWTDRIIIAVYWRYRHLLHYLKSFRNRG